MSAATVDISDDLLFPVPQALSKRLAWMKKHGIVTYKLEDDAWIAGFQAWHPTVTHLGQFFCDETNANSDNRIGQGDTESEATADLLSCGYARVRNIKLWNEEGDA